MYVLGCDPGKTGAIVAVSTDGDLVVLRTPHSISAKGRGEEIQYNLWWERYKRIIMPLKPAHVFIERVQAMPKQGSSSGFKFGTSFGALIMLTVTQEIPWDRVEPQAWKKTARIPSKSEKIVSTTRACELWPKHSELFVAKRLVQTTEEAVGVADSALIGYHGLSLLGKAPITFNQPLAVDDYDF